MATEARAASVPTPPEMSPARRYVILGMVVLSVTLYSTSILIVAAVLPQLQGAMQATPDEISWTMTFNILATAMCTPLTGWLTARFGRRNLLAGSVMLFAAATYFCGAATSLEALIFWRIVQGAAGAPLPPVGQSVTLDIFPKHQHGMVVGLYGVGVVMGAFIGPMVGGVMAEWYSWRYAFYLMVPVAVLSSIGVLMALPRTRRQFAVKLEWTGFLLITTSIACIQLALSRGQRLDWFESTEIVVEVFVGVLALYLFVVHSLTHDKPFLNLRLLLNKNYSIGLILVTIYGMLNFTPMVILPGLLREHVGLPDSLVGYVVGARGIGAMAAFYVASFLGQKFPRKSIAAGFGFQVIAGLWLMTVSLDTTPMEFVLNGIVQGFAVGTIWVPLTVVTFSTLDPKYLDETSSMYHLLRNIGSSFFISMTVTELVRSSAMNYEYMTGFISPFNQMLQMPWVMGERSLDTVEGLARMSQEIVHQASLISYLNAFGMYTLASAAAIPLIMFITSPKKAAAGA
ncbi:MAG: DHA2 family efflux MFS transporter permease subunit [Rhodospirillales bacterium]|nr:DHA2 family efflux MFS transporter permease subunit [Rhodospirillales bacterium]MBO6788658.1 DHA2 family efflux MFS transporter permease subunit [Rhodospirillales bacterium]